MKIPFTYLIGWSKLNKFYYGVRYGAKSHPDTLWTTYFTSSKDVFNFRALNGEPDVISIRKTFQSADAARTWEFKILKRLHAASSPKWLNRREAPAIPTFSGAANPMFGKTHSNETRKLISDKAKNRKWKINDKRRCADIYQGDKNPFFGKTHTEETKAKIKTARSKQSGALNSTAKTFTFINPEFETFTVTGNFSGFCNSHQLSRTKMILFLDKGIIPEFIGNNMTTQQTKNCIGWSVSLSHS